MYIYVYSCLVTWEYTLYTAFYLTARRVERVIAVIAPGKIPCKEFQLLPLCALPRSFPCVHVSIGLISHTCHILAAFGVTASFSSRPSMHSSGAVGIDSRRAYGTTHNVPCLSQWHSPHARHIHANVPLLSLCNFSHVIVGTTHCASVLSVSHRHCSPRRCTEWASVFRKRD